MARTTIHAVSRRGGGAPKYVAAYSVHEWDPRKSGVPEYRRSLEMQVRCQWWRGGEAVPQ